MRKSTAEDRLMSALAHACSATHPLEPNYSGNSRGRKYHLTTDNIKTLCAMLVDELLVTRHSDQDLKHKPHKVWMPTIIDNGSCGNCRILAERQHLEFDTGLKVEYSR